MNVRGYFFPTLYAVLLHVGIALAFVINWQSAPTPRLSITPVAVKAQLVQMKDVKPQPAATRKPEPKPAPKPEPKPAPKPEPKPQPKPPPVAKPVPKPAPPKPAPPKPAPPKVDRTAAREALARSSLDQALETEARALAAREGREAADEVEAFAAAISAMVEQNWSRPPSARNGMQVEIQINLVPTGEVVGVVVLQSSGDRLFDQSAERAVWRAARFDVPDDPQKFERYFRRFRMVFRPEDLLR